jgi:hypothetical protein
LKSNRKFRQDAVLTWRFSYCRFVVALLLETESGPWRIRSELVLRSALPTSDVLLSQKNLTESIK